MTSIKKLLKSTKLYYRYKLTKNYMKSQKNYAEIEKEIGKKYQRINGRTLNWDNPCSYTEKLNYSKLYNTSPERTNLTDKYLVRTWVENKIGNEYLIPLIGVYDSFDDIDFDALPKSFIIKCNHDSGSTTVVKDKTKVNIPRLKEEYEFYLKRNFAFNTYEMHYNEIAAKIIIERLVSPSDGGELSDYKFLCFNGKPYYCWVDIDRFQHHRRNFYDVKWVPQPFKQYHYDNNEYEIAKPDNLEQMVQIVTKLCEGFDHVRVDLYNVDGRIYFGEMTFTNGSGYEEIQPDEWDYKLGELWELDTSRRK